MIAFLRQPDPPPPISLAELVEGVGKSLVNAAPRLNEQMFVETVEIELPCGCKVFERFIPLSDVEDCARHEAATVAAERLVIELLDDTAAAARSITGTPRGPKHRDQS